MASPIVITVHGTGAGTESVDPPKWWQTNSDFCNDLRDQTAPGFETDTFKWSGHNSENDRRIAGRGLFERILLFENSAKPYHLIGHSHGGSVIWHALQYSARKKKKLNHLKSVNTIGTPFMKYKADTSFLLLPIVIMIGLIPLNFSDVPSRSLFDWFLVLRDSPRLSLTAFLFLTFVYALLLGGALFSFCKRCCDLVWD